MKNNKKYLKSSIIISIILSVIYVICDSINKDYFINVLNAFSIVKLIGYFILFYFIINSFYIFLDGSNNIKTKETSFLDSSRKSFIINFIIIFITNLLFLLRYYPGNLTFDSYTEIKQATGILKLSNIHSLLHTLIIRFFTTAFSNINVAVFMYSLFQIIIVSLLFSYILRLLAKNNVSLVYRFICLLFYAFHPINIFYSFTVWKDVLFSVTFVLFCLMLKKSDDLFKNKKSLLSFVVVTLLMMSFRNNGPFVVYISFLIIIFLKKKYLKKFFLLFTSIIIIFLVTKISVFKIFNIKDVSVSEALSIPTQSIARIYKYNYEDLSIEEKKSIENFYSNKIGEVYIPYISDNTKRLLNTTYYKKHMNEYIDLNIKLFKKYPKLYLESFISNSYGYYYTNYDYSSIIIGNVYELGIEHKELLSMKIILVILFIIFSLLFTIFIKNLENKKIIIYFILLIILMLSTSKFSIKENYFISLLFNIGFYSILTILLFIYNIINRRDITYFIPVILLWLMILLSPVFAEFRYLYPLFLMFPIYFCDCKKKS